MMGIGALAGGVGSIMGGMSANQDAKDQARLVKRQGHANAYAASVEAENERTASRLLQGTARAQYAASGIRTDVGSAADVSTSISQESIDKQAKLAWGGRIHQENAAIEAAALRKRGKNAQTAGIIEGVSGMATGMASAGSAGMNNLDMRASATSAGRPDPFGAFTNPTFLSGVFGV